MRRTHTEAAISTLTLVLSQLMGRSVVDRTPLPASVPEGPSLTTLLQDDLGLKLDSQRGRREVIVIDSAERPTPD